ncbi:hypothetical protein STVA_31670 [Allostella vacuolata]|nr:hypothetical protein STVA_31670 [Stella vacuolata]
MSPRYAIYYAPAADSPLAAFAASWLGRSFDGRPVGDRPALPGIPAGRLEALTAEPRRYGFHGTLKPPFHLADGHAEAELAAAVEAIAHGLRPFALPPLRLERLGGFLALVSSGPSAALAAVEAACVTRLDRFRAPPTESELARRRRARLTERQERLLAAWGYPYVLEEFQFHLTLTGRMEPDEQECVRSGLEPLVAAFCRAPTPFADLALFIEAEPGAPFALARRFPLGEG